MNCTTSRFGTADGPFASAVVAPQTGRDSSHGSVMTTPAPFRKMRRERFLFRFAFIVHPSRSWSPTERPTGSARRGSAPVAELRACDNRVHQTVETVAVRGQAALHPEEHRVVRRLQGSSQSIG